LFVFGSAETAQKDACCVQMLDTRPELHACAELNCALSVQICIVCSDHLLFKGGPEPSNFEDLCLVNVSVKYFIKLCFGTSKIQLN